MFNGESLQLVYALLLRVYKALEAANVPVRVVFYDVACKLYAVAQGKKNSFPPLTEQVAGLKYLLDGFHRDNHVWCLQHMPHVDPERPENQEWRRHTNSEAAEQLNSWISGRAVAATEMTYARYFVYWHALFREHNAWLVRQQDRLPKRLPHDVIIHASVTPQRSRHPCAH